MIRVTEVHFGPETEEAVLAVVRSGQLAQGPVVDQLEAGFRELVGVEHALAVNNGTTALEVACEALEVAPGDEVVTSPFTFVATLNAALHSGATVRFGDIGDDFLLDPATVGPLLTDRTRVVMPVHLYGLPADMPAFMELAAGSGAAVIEDAAQAHGATIGGQGAGSFGIGCFSLYATKNITSGEGGVVTTGDATLADKVGLIRNQGMRARYQYEMVGHNFRLTDLHAAVAVPQLATYPAVLERRRANAARLSSGLADVPGMVVPTVPEGRTHVWHQYTVRVLPGASRTRDEVVDFLGTRGVGSGVYYPRAVYDYPVFRDHPRVVVDGSPRAEQIASEVISLPVHQFLSDTDVDRVIAAVREALA